MTILLVVTDVSDAVLSMFCDSCDVDELDYEQLHEKKVILATLQLDLYLKGGG